MRLLLWRHGRTSWNNVGRFQGQADPPLDDTGRNQAALVGPMIAALRPELVVSSDLVRCRDTAATIGLEPRLDARLREISLGAWSGLTSAEAAVKFPDEDAAWRRGSDVRRGGGETYAEVGVRAGAVLDELFAEGLPADPDGLIVFVLHGGTARALIGRLLGMPHDAWWRFGPLGNCRWSLLRTAESGFRLIEHNVGLPAGAASAAVEATSTSAATVAAAAGTLLPEQQASAAPDVEPTNATPHR